MIIGWLVRKRAKRAFLRSLRSQLGKRRDWGRSCRNGRRLMIFDHQSCHPGHFLAKSACNWTWTPPGWRGAAEGGLWPPSHVVEIPSSIGMGYRQEMAGMALDYWSLINNQRPFLSFPVRDGLQMDSRLMRSARTPGRRPLTASGGTRASEFDWYGILDGSCRNWQRVSMLCMLTSRQFLTSPDRDGLQLDLDLRELTAPLKAAFDRFLYTSLRNQRPE